MKDVRMEAVLGTMYWATLLSGLLPTALAAVVLSLVLKWLQRSRLQRPRGGLPPARDLMARAALLRQGKGGPPPQGS